MGDELSSIRIRGRLYDDRVSALISLVQGFDASGLYFLDFDILAAHCLIEGRTLLPSPYIDLCAPDAEIARVLEMYSGMIDRIWDFFGGCSRAKFEAMAVWMMDKKSAAGLHLNDFGGPFAAFLYGESDRARQLLVDLEERWEQRMRDEPDNTAVLEVRNEVLETIARARTIIARQRPWS